MGVLSVEASGCYITSGKGLKLSYKQGGTIEKFYRGYKEYSECSIKLGLDGIVLEAERPVKKIGPRAGDR